MIEKESASNFVDLMRQGHDDGVKYQQKEPMSTRTGSHPPLIHQMKSRYQSQNLSPTMNEVFQLKKGGGRGKKKKKTKQKKLTA